MCAYLVFIYLHNDFSYIYIYTPMINVKCSKTE